MKRLWMTVVIGACAMGLGAQDANPANDTRTLRPQQATAQAESPEARTALVIGNGAYHSAPLKNPVQDARAMAEALRKCGFRVTLLENANRSHMVQAIRDFGQTIQGGGVGLLYYAGHGMQVKGKNYLVPVDADLASEDEVPYNTLDADAVLAKMESARNRLNILILDACRNNPFGRSFRSSSQGLAQMDAPAGSYIAFATSPGRTAADGTGSHGLYTQHLLDQLARPGVKVEDVFKRVRASVMRDSQQQQVPWESSSITGDFYFVPGASLVAAEPAPLPAPQPPASGSTLLDRCLEARGGTRAWLAVQTLRTKGKWAMDQTEIPFTRDEAREGNLRTESKFMDRGQKVLMLMVLSGDRAVGLALTEDRTKVIEPPTAMNDLEVLMMRNLFGLSDPLLAAAQGQARWEDAGTASLEGSLLRLLRVVTPDGQEYLYRIDGATFLPESVHARYKTGGGSMESEVRLSRYQKVGALLMPFRQEILDKETKNWIPRESLEEVLLNPAFPADHFNLPEVPAPGAIPAREGLDPEAAEGERLFQEAMAEWEDGRPKDPKKADDLLHRAAAKGHVQAMVTLAQNHQNGNGVPQDDGLAAWWFLQAAGSGDAVAQTRTGANFENGTGLEKNLKEALSWYQKAAEQGEMWGQEALGAMYEFGRGCPKDPAKALFWYRKSAEQNWNDAQLALGRMYELGKGVPKDLRQAAEWYRKAAKDGNGNAKEALARLGVK